MPPLCKGRWLREAKPEGLFYGKTSIFAIKVQKFGIFTHKATPQSRIRSTAPRKVNCRIAAREGGLGHTQGSLWKSTFLTRRKGLLPYGSSSFAMFISN